MKRLYLIDPDDIELLFLALREEIGNNFLLQKKSDCYYLYPGETPLNERVMQIINRFQIIIKQKF